MFSEPHRQFNVRDRTQATQATIHRSIPPGGPAAKAGTDVSYKRLQLDDFSVYLNPLGELDRRREDSGRWGGVRV